MRIYVDDASSFTQLSPLGISKAFLLVVPPLVDFSQPVNLVIESWVQRAAF